MAIASTLIGLSVASNASAATVLLTLDKSAAPGHFKVFAEASIGDNGGIAHYGIPLLGNVTSIDHVSPNTAFATNAASAFGPAGFTALRIPDGDKLLGAAQDTFAPTPLLIYGFGQTAGSFAGVGITPLAPAEQPAWDAKLLIAQGTYTGDVAFNSTSLDLFANVFIAPGNKFLELARLFLIGDTTIDVIAVDTNLGQRTRDSVISHLFTTLSGEPPLTWRNLNHDGPAVGDRATLSADGSFRWNPIAAGLGVHRFFATVSNASDSDFGQLTITIIPEPASVVLVGAAIVTLPTAAARRKPM